MDTARYRRMVGEEVAVVVAVVAVGKRVHPATDPEADSTAVVADRRVVGCRNCSPVVAEEVGCRTDFYFRLIRFDTAQFPCPDRTSAIRPAAAEVDMVRNRFVEVPAVAVCFVPPVVVEKNPKYRSSAPSSVSLKTVAAVVAVVYSAPVAAIAACRMSFQGTAHSEEPNSPNLKTADVEAAVVVRDAIG